MKGRNLEPPVRGSQALSETTEIEDYVLATKNWNALGMPPSQSARTGPHPRWLANVVATCWKTISAKLLAQLRRPSALPSSRSDGENCVGEQKAGNPSASAIAEHQSCRHTRCCSVPRTRPSQSPTATDVETGNENVRRDLATPVNVLACWSYPDRHLLVSNVAISMHLDPTLPVCDAQVAAALLPPSSSRQQDPKC